MILFIERLHAGGRGELCQRRLGRAERLPVLDLGVVQGDLGVQDVEKIDLVYLVGRQHGRHRLLRLGNNPGLEQRDLFAGGLVIRALAGNGRLDRTQRAGGTRTLAG